MDNKKKNFGLDFLKIFCGEYMRRACRIMFPLLCIFFFSSCLKSSDVKHVKFVMIDYRYGRGDELNTFNDTFIKRFDGNVKIKIKLRLFETDQDEIIHKAIAINYFQMPDTLSFSNENPGELNLQGKSRTDLHFLRIKYKNLDKKIVWLGTLPYNNSTYKGLYELTALIRDAVESKPEYKALPGVNSGLVQYYFGIVKLLLSDK